ncbi:MAG: hypothetical protein AAFV25_25660 [Bacteroidota bacterium]
MKDLNKRVTKAMIEFKQSKASEKSVEGLYDIVYFLQQQERSFQEDYILAQIHFLLGNLIDASKVIQKALPTANDKQIKKLQTLSAQIDKQNKWNVKVYRDLRDAKTPKEVSKLSTNDFLLSQSDTAIKIVDDVPYIVIAHKTVKNGPDISIHAPLPHATDLIDQLIDHIQWLGQLKTELIHFYNRSNFDYQLDHVGQDWFDGLQVSNVSIEVDGQGQLFTEIVFQDYRLNDLGLVVEMKGNDILSMAYDPIQ